MSNSSFHKILLFLVVSFLMGGCKDLAPPFPKQEPVKIPPRIPVAPGNALRVFSLAQNYAQGQDTLTPLVQEFAKLSPAQLRQLAQKKDADEHNFLSLLSQGLVNSYVVDVTRNFFDALPHELVEAQVQAKVNGRNAFQNLRSLGRDPRENNQKRLQLIALLVIADPGLINQLNDNAGAFDPEEFNTIINAIPPEKMSGPLREVAGDKLSSWLTWAVSDLGWQALNDRFFPTFPKIYKNTSPENKALMRDTLLERVYQADTNEVIAGNDPHFVADFVDEMTRLGLAQNLGDDLYQINKNPAAGGKHSGSFLYVVTKRIADDLVAGPGLSLNHLRKITKNVKQILADNYQTHVTSNKFGPAANESILTIVSAAGFNQQQAKLILHLPIELDDIYQELRRVAMEAAIADRKVSVELKELLEDYLAAHQTLDQVVDISVPAPDNGQGNLIEGDKFIHIVSTFKTNADLKEVLELLLAHSEEKALVIVEKNTHNQTIFNRLTDPLRALQAIGGEHNNIIDYLLTEVLNHGDSNALLTAFNGINDNSPNVLAKFSYLNRDHAIVAGGASVGSIFAQSYSGRLPLAAHALAKAILEQAISDAGIGNANSGVITLITKGFLPVTALQYTGYDLFGSGAQIGNNNSLLYDVLLYTAATRIAGILNQPNPSLRVLGILDNKVRGRSNAFIRGVYFAAPLETNQILANLSGSLNQAEVQALAQAFKTALGNADWGTLAGQATNATTRNRQAWQILQFTIAGGAVPDEATARSANYLDY